MKRILAPFFSKAHWSANFSIMELVKQTDAAKITSASDQSCSNMSLLLTVIGAQGT